MLRVDESMSVVLYCMYQALFVDLKYYSDVLWEILLVTLLVYKSKILTHTVIDISDLQPRT